MYQTSVIQQKAFKYSSLTLLVIVIPTFPFQLSVKMLRNSEYDKRTYGLIVKPHLGGGHGKEMWVVYHSVIILIGKTLKIHDTVMLS